MLRWIAFDAVGTLIYPEPGVVAVYAQIGRKYGSQLTEADIRMRFRSAFAASTVHCLPNDQGQLPTSEELEVRRWEWIVEQTLPDVTNPAACFVELYDHFARPESWRVFDDVAETFRRLGELDMRIAIASNFDQRLHSVCRGLPELRSTEVVVVSTDVGACKPSPRFFSALLESCGCAADELLMVGDDVEADVTGPHKFGIKAVLLDRDKSSDSIEAIQSVRELVARLS